MSAAAAAGIGRRDVLMSPKKQLAPKPTATATSGKSVLKVALPKKPLPSKPLAEDLAFLGAASANAASQPIAKSTDNLEDLWSLPVEEEPSCIYPEVNTSVLLKDEDPFMPHKSSPQPQQEAASIKDLWSFEGVSSSNHVEWDLNDPMTQFVNPYVAEGFSASAFEKSTLRSNSKVPIEEEEEESPATEVVDIKEEEVVIDQPSAVAGESPEFLAEIKSEPEDTIQPNIQCPQVPTFSSNPSQPQLMEVLKAEFVYYPQPQDETPAAAAAAAEPMEIDHQLDVLGGVCDDQVSVAAFQSLLDNIAEPDPVFMAEAEQQLQAVAAERQQEQQQQQQEQQLTAAASSFDTVNINDINEWVDPAIIPILAEQQEASSPKLSSSFQVETTPPQTLPQSPPQALSSDHVPDLLEDLVDRIIMSDDTEPAVTVSQQPTAVDQPAAAAAVEQPAAVEEQPRRPRRQPGRPQVAPPPPSVAAESHQRAPRMSLADPNARYRRMRNLNNEASRRCRQNRNKKFNDLLEELKVQEARNQDLKIKYNLLVEAKDQAKKIFLEMIAGAGQQPRN